MSGKPKTWANVWFSLGRPGAAKPTLPEWIEVGGLPGAILVMLVSQGQDGWHLGGTEWSRGVAHLRKLGVKIHRIPPSRAGAPVGTPGKWVLSGYVAFGDLTHSKDYFDPDEFKAPGQ